MLGGLERGGRAPILRQGCVKFHPFRFVRREKEREKRDSGKTSILSTFLEKAFSPLLSFTPNKPYVLMVMT